MEPESLVALYARVSTPIQARGDGLPRQRRVIKKYCLYRRWLPVEYVEDIHSAYRDENLCKSNLWKMLEGWDKDGCIVSHLLLEDYDRLSRYSVLTNLNLVSRIANHGVKIISIYGDEEFQKYLADEEERRQGRWSLRQLVLKAQHERKMREYRLEEIKRISANIRRIQNGTLPATQT